MKVQVFHSNLADFRFPIKRTGMIQWPFTDTTMNGNRHFTSKRLFIRFVKFFYVLCGSTWLFGFFYLCFMMTMSEILDRGQVQVRMPRYLPWGRDFHTE